MVSKLMQVFTLGLVLSSFYLLAFWLWKRLWFKSFGAELPVDRSF